MKTITLTAQTVRIEHPQASYGIFCFNSAGDLFLSSDWGFYAYSWRAFGDDFIDFLAYCNTEYIVGKFAITYQEQARRRLAQMQQNKLSLLVEEFRKVLQDQILTPKTK